MTTDISQNPLRRPILFGLLGLLVLLALPACGGNLAMTLKAGEFATREKANAEMEGWYHSSIKKFPYYIVRFKLSPIMVL